MAEKTISGQTYRTDKLPATEAVRLLARISKLLGPALGELEGAIRAGDDTSRSTAGLRALSSMLEHADVDEVVNMVTDVVGCVSVKVNGRYEPCVLDHHFDGDLVSAFKVVGWVLEVNYRDFFGAFDRLPFPTMTPPGPSAQA